MALWRIWGLTALYTGTNDCVEQPFLLTIAVEMYSRWGMIVEAYTGTGSAEVAFITGNFIAYRDGFFCASSLSQRMQKRILLLTFASSQTYSTNSVTRSDETSRG
jgi:hypothetical protein